MINVAIMGYGTVGAGVFKVLTNYGLWHSWGRCFQGSYYEP